MPINIDDTVSQLHAAGKFWVPSNLREDLLRRHGAITVADFDRFHKLNDRIGAAFDNCASTMIYGMNTLAGDLDHSFQKMICVGSGERAVVCELFNITQALVRANVGEKGVWYVLGGKPLVEERDFSVAAQPDPRTYWSSQSVSGT